MLRRLPVLLLAMLMEVAMAHATNTARIQGRVTDSSGAAISNATVSLLDLTTNQLIHTTTTAEGQFAIDNVPADPQLVTIEKDGFESFTQRLSPASQHTIAATLQVATLAESVIVRGTVDPEAKPVPTREDVMLMPQTVRVLDRKQLDAAGPVAGGAQVLQSSPGANVVGYGETGGTKYTILLNGIQQGWAGEATSFTAPGSLGITYDGIPVADPATGLWQSATMPQNLVMQDVQVTYGPGQAADRWYTDVGGRVEYTPIQPTEETHLSAAVTDGPWGQQNFAFVGNTGNFKGWSTVVGGGVGRGDDYRPAPDGFGDPSKNGSVFGKTVKSFTGGSLAFGVLYAKGGGYRAQVIPTTNVGLLEPGTNTYYSQASSGFYSSLPFADYNKYDTNEGFMAYARQRMYLSHTSTLENSAWYTHIRRFHRRNEDALAQGSQVDEWNNPHSNMFGDHIGFSQIFPYNTVQFGGYLIHEVYNAHNLFYNPSDGGSGAQQIVGAGSKFRSGYFQQDNVTFFAQDDFHPIPQIHIIPSVRVDGFSTGYSDQAARDFTFAPSTYFAVNSNGTVYVTNGPVYQTHCSLNPQTGSSASDPYYNIFGTPVTTPDGNQAKDQGSLCGAHESRSAVEPGIDASVTPRQWLTIYGGYDTTYRSPALGGGGGMFQAVNPNYYILAKGAYAQFGAKVHFTNAPGLRNFIAGVNYFHNNYTNQEIDVETAAGVEETSGGNSVYHGVDAFFDADPRSNIHFFFNFAGEASNFTTYVTGGPSLAGSLPPPLRMHRLITISRVLCPELHPEFRHLLRDPAQQPRPVEPRFWVESHRLAAPVVEQYRRTHRADHAVLHNREPRRSTPPSPSLRNSPSTLSSTYEYRQLAVQRIRVHLQRRLFCGAWPRKNNIPNGYINAYPGAPRSIYGTISYQF